MRSNRTAIILFLAVVGLFTMVSIVTAGNTSGWPSSLATAQVGRMFGVAVLFAALVGVPILVCYFSGRKLPPMRDADIL